MHGKTMNKDNEIESMKQLGMRNKNGVIITKNLKDPFNFHLPISYLDDLGTSLSNLATEVTVIPEQGKWKGWVYETNLTMRKFNEDVKPVYMAMENGVITFRPSKEGKVFKNLVPS